VRRDRRQDARPGLVKMYAYHQPGPGGLPLGLASTEGLGLTGGARRGFHGVYGPFASPQPHLGMGASASTVAPACELMTARREPHSR